MAKTTLTVTATEATTRFGPLLEPAIAGGAVLITKHDTPKAVLLSMAEFEALEFKAFVTRGAAMAVHEIPLSGRRWIEKTIE